MLQGLLAADGAPMSCQGGGGDWSFLVLMAGMFAIMYFLVIRPQRRREAARKAMIAAVRKNDRILTSGGIVGTVTNLRDADVTIRIDDDKNVRIKVNRNYIVSVLDKENADDAQ